MRIPSATTIKPDVRPGKVLGSKNRTDKIYKTIIIILSVTLYGRETLFSLQENNIEVSLMVSWVVTSRSLVGGHQIFGGTYRNKPLRCSKRL
jgi:hypothetical protein